MQLNEQKIKGMFWGALTGDAIGTPFEGLTKAHIRSVFKSIDSYKDTSEALKGKPETWKKPSLYSAASQLMILMYMFTTVNKRPGPNAFVEFIFDALKGPDNEYGIFRHSSAMIRHFINTTKVANNKSASTVFSGADASGAIILAPLSLNVENDESQVEQLLSFSLIFNKDIDSTAGNLIFIALLKTLQNKDNSTSPEKILDFAIEATKFLLEKLYKISPKIFEFGLNPDYILSSVRDFINILEKIINITDIDSAEKIIYGYVNTKLKTPVTRATVNHPLAIIPFSMYLSRCFLHSPSDTLFRAVEYGGSASILCALTGALTGALFGFEHLPENLVDELINKKRIAAIGESVYKGKITSDLIQDFIAGERSLSEKEIQERNARLKHVKVKTKKKKSRHEIEKELSGHIVESWTKFDKAKWRRKLDRENDDI